MRIPLLLLLGALTTAAESYPVASVPAGDRVVIQYKGLPIAVGLALIEVPTAQQAAAREALIALTAKKSAELIYLADYGADAVGGARVQLQVGTTTLNEELVARGLAKYQPTAKPSAAEGIIKRAQDKAQKVGIGLWKGAAAPATVTLAKGPFCAELDNGYYYPTGSREVANVSAQRLIYYPDELTAQKAGKRKAIKVEAVKRGTTEADADAAYASGKEVASRAVDAGNTPKRDELYEKAYQDLTQAMQIYSALVEAEPDDEALSGKLRDCMQLRYGTVKMRRFH